MHGSPPRAWGRPDRGRPACRKAAVHPHVRGDGFPLADTSRGKIGSPPRAWGRRLATGEVFARSWFTPTCVGTAGALSRARQPQSVHPHVRGDGPNASMNIVSTRGSPPRAWGRPGHQLDSLCQERFTPTCVGTARRQEPVRPLATVHPHVRGDGSSGSSGCLSFRRFTPTCVGTAPERICSMPIAAVHPHVRGDGGGVQMPNYPAFGSPPRAWGRLSAAAVGGRPLRFTPTCVGTASWMRSWISAPSVHPHVRGDGYPPPQSAAGHYGSPPRAWGRLRG